METHPYVCMWQVVEGAGIGALAMVADTATYESIASSLLYAQDAEWSFIYNILAHYDLPDLSAALLGPPESAVNCVSQLVVAPVNARNQLLNASEVARTYRTYYLLTT